MLTIAVANSLSRPVAELTRVADSIAHGEMDRTIAGRGNRELKSLAGSISTMQDSIRRTISALKAEIHDRRIQFAGRVHRVYPEIVPKKVADYFVEIADKYRQE